MNSRNGSADQLREETLRDRSAPDLASHKSPLNKERKRFRRALRPSP
jgi:hypothetical protein